ncbi:MAG TPA: hypothetical protein VGX28_09210 [Frankiaceae bacterium]|jgi:hypothetical protein|nr:hypothetical protein [Frankiaceae bacterium]
MSDATPRELWGHFEPLHAVTYFAPETAAAFEEVGLRGFWRTYFAGRAAPLGAVGPEVVQAAFYGFAPAMVRRAFPDVWERAAPSVALDARRAGAGRALRRLAPEAAWGEVADVLQRALAGAEVAGRVLGAATAALPVPGDDVERAWHAATALRELRGDAHVAALLAYGVGPCESLVLRARADVPRERSQPVRGWTDEEWEAAAEALRERGLVDGEGVTTGEGMALREAIERATDAAAAAPWAAFGDGEIEAAKATLKPVALACLAEVPPQLPIALPRIA